MVVGLPLAMPFLGLVRDHLAWGALSNYKQLGNLAGNTIVLVLGTLLIAVPLGTVLAILLHRTDLPLRRFLRFLMILTLFVPLPLFAAGWQAVIGFAPSGIVLRPWVYGMSMATWIHALAGLPWVVILVGQGLCWVEPELEEDALLVAGTWRVLWSVTLVRGRAAIAAAALWVALQAAGEVAVTDVLQVPTYARVLPRACRRLGTRARSCPGSNIAAGGIDVAAGLVGGQALGKKPAAA